MPRVAFDSLQPADDRATDQFTVNSKALPALSFPFWVGTHFAQSSVLQIRSVPLVTVRVNTDGEKVSRHVSLPVLVRLNVNSCFPSCLTFW